MKYVYDIYLFLYLIIEFSIKEKETSLTSTFMGDMSEESCNLAFGVINRANPTELRIRVESLKKSLTRVEALTGTVLIKSLILDPIEETWCHYVCH